MGNHGPSLKMHQCCWNRNQNQTGTRTVNVSEVSNRKENTRLCYI